MSMCHTAFAFDYYAFCAELRPILESAMRTGDCSRLIQFMDENCDQMQEPGYGETLGAGWRSKVNDAESIEAFNRYGELAVTKYYDVLADIGLTELWIGIDDLCFEQPDLSAAPILGETIYVGDKVFDPAQVGTYFQTPAQVSWNKEFLSKVPRPYICPNKESERDEYSDEVLENAISMLAMAENANLGLYVTL